MEIKGKLVIDWSLFLTEAYGEEYNRCKESLNTILLPYLNKLTAFVKGLKIEEVSKEELEEFYKQQATLNWSFGEYVSFKTQFSGGCPTLEDIEKAVKEIHSLQSTVDKLLKEAENETPKHAEMTRDLANIYADLIVSQREMLIEEFQDYLNGIISELTHNVGGIEYIVEEE